MGNFELGQVYDLKLSELKPNPHQPRTVFQDTEIRELANSIDEKGLLQPILVKELEDGQIIIVSGERRFRAHQLLERDKIPAWFTTGAPEELALVENLVRENLSAMETAEALKKFADKFNINTHEDLGKRIGKSKSAVSEILSLNKLSVSIRNTIRGDKDYALRELKKIATYKTPKAQEKLFATYKAKIEAESQAKAPRVRSKGADLHQKKITAMQAYFSKMRDEDKIEELIDLQDELTQLKKTLELILNNFN